MGIIKKKNNQTELDMLSLAVEMLRKVWLVILISALCAGLLTGYYYYKAPEYKAQIVLYVHNTSNPGETGNITTSDIAASAMLLQTYANVIKSDILYDRVNELSGQNFSPEQMSQMIEIDSAENTAMMVVGVKNSSPKVAALLANTIAEIISANYASLVPGSSVRVLEYAKVPTKREGLSYTKIAVMGVAIGFILSACIIVLASLKRKKIKKEKDLKTINYPILGQINTLEVPDSLDGIYDELKKNTLYSLPGKKCKRIAVTSSSSNENKSMVTMLLSMALAKNGYKVLQIDCDLCNGDLTKLMKKRVSPGITEVLTGSALINSAVCYVSSDLNFVPCGEHTLNPLKLLKSGELENAFKKIESQYDFIMIDLPSADNSEEMLAVCGSTTGVIMNIRMNNAWKQDVESAIQLMEAQGVNILGLTIMN